MEDPQNAYSAQLEAIGDDGAALEGDRPNALGKVLAGRSARGKRAQLSSGRGDA
jgi:hypothetical protein